MSAGFTRVIGTHKRWHRTLVVALVAIGCVTFVSLDFAWYGGGWSTVPSYAPPRTPWGDPDLQGAFTNTDERTTPMEQPESQGWFYRFSDAVLSVWGPPASHTRRGIEWEPIFEEPATKRRGWLIVDPPDGRVPSLTKQALRRREAEYAMWRDVRDTMPWAPLGLFVRCISRGTPGSMVPFFYGNVYDITQGPGVVAIRYEMINETRIISLDGHAHVGTGVRSYMGDARGHFKGDTLVVETTNFNSKASFRSSSESLRLVERFTPVAADTLEWSVTLDDPATWSRPWTFVMNLTRTTEGPLEFACHEGNYALRNMLAIRASTPVKQTVTKREASIVDN
jgi:hypothetical protein